MFTQSELALEKLDASLERLYLLRQMRDYDPRNHVGNEIVDEIIFDEAGVHIDPYKKAPYASTAPDPVELLDNYVPIFLRFQAE